MEGDARRSVRPTDDPARYSRQARLAEIGAAGQTRLAESEVKLSRTGVAGDVEERYLLAAGVGQVVGSESASAPAPSTFGIEDCAALDVAQGAHAALIAIRAIVGVR